MNRNELRARLHGRQQQHPHASRAKRPAAITADAAVAPTKRQRVQQPPQLHRSQQVQATAHFTPSTVAEAPSATATMVKNNHIVAHSVQQRQHQLLMSGSGANQMRSTVAATTLVDTASSTINRKEPQPQHIATTTTTVNEVSKVKSTMIARETPQTSANQLELQKELELLDALKQKPVSKEVELLRKLTTSNVDEPTIEHALFDVKPKDALKLLQSFALSSAACSKLVALAASIRPCEIDIHTIRVLIPFLRAYQLKGVAGGIAEFTAQLMAQLHMLQQQQQQQQPNAVDPLKHAGFKNPPPNLDLKSSTSQPISQNFNEGNTRAIFNELSSVKMMEIDGDNNDNNSMRDITQKEISIQDEGLVEEETEMEEETVMEEENLDQTPEKTQIHEIPKELPFLGMMHHTQLDICEADRILALTLSECFELICIKIDKKDKEGKNFDISLVIDKLERMARFAKKNSTLVSRQIPLLATKLQNLIENLSGRELRGTCVVPLLLYSLDMLINTMVLHANWKVAAKGGNDATKLANTPMHIQSTFIALDSVLQVFQNRKNRQIPFLIEKALKATIQFVKDNPEHSREFLMENILLLREIMERQHHGIPMADKEILKRELSAINAASPAT